MGTRDGENETGAIADGNQDPSADHRVGTTVEDGEVKQLSVSSIAKYDPGQPGGCPRRWWYHYVAGKKEPQGKAAAKGAAVHRQIEKHLLEGQALTGVARCAAPLCREVLKYDTRFAVEQLVDGGLVAAGIPLVGRIDLVRWDRQSITDWKTTGKTEADLPIGQALLSTVQMPGYGKWYLNAVPDAKDVWLEHAYLKAGWREPVRRGWKWHRSQIDERWAQVELVVGELKQVAKAERAEDVPYNLDACEYCPHWSYCPAGRRGMTMGTLVEEMKKRKQKKTDVLPPDAPASGEAAPAADPMTLEELAAQPPAVQEAIQGLTRVAYKLVLEEAHVHRTVNLGDYNSAQFGLKARVEGTPSDPMQPLRDLTKVIDDYAKEYKANG